MRVDGPPILFQQISPKISDINVTLISGFFSALKSLSDIVNNENSTFFQINYGERVISLLSGKTIMLAIISERADISQSMFSFYRLMEEIEVVLPREDEIVSPYPNFVIEKIRELITEIIGIPSISLKWVPIMVRQVDVEKSSSKFQVLHSIDGNKTIAEIIDQDSEQGNEFLSEIAKLWALGDIKFLRILEEQDYITAKSKIYQFIQNYSPERYELSLKFSKSIEYLPTLIQHLKNGVMVNDLISLDESNWSYEIYDLLDYLLSINAIEILPPEKRGIILIQRMASLCLKISENFYTPDFIINSVKESLDIINSPEIRSEIIFTKTGVEIDRNFLVYSNLKPDEIMKIYDFWFDFIQEFMMKLISGNYLEFIDYFSEILKNELIINYTSEDLIKVQKFSTWFNFIFNQPMKN